jgi:hypothetical protein
VHYYTDDGTKFSSKIEALEYSKNKKQKVQFYYYDDIYEKINWSIEPTESLDYYYLEQARRIRDSYDYVILCYSGGYDSSNILETFYFNNIHLDKIVVVGALNEDSSLNSDDNHNGELYHNVFPYLKELNLESITQIIDYSKLFNNIKNFSVNSYSSNWVDYMGGWFSPHNWFWRDLEKYVIPAEYKNKRVGIIFGRDKPSLFSKMIQRQDKLNGFYFRDTPITSYGNVSSVYNCDRINFYWDPNYPFILLKQLHVLKKFYSINRFNKDEFFPRIPINDIVYNLRKKILFKSPKSPTSILSLRDNFLKSKKNNDVYDLYEKGISVISHRIELKKIVPIYSRFYDLTKNVQE